METLRGALADANRGGVRALGGLLFGVAILVVLYRRTSMGDPWGDLPIFLVLAVASAFLYGLGLAGARVTAATQPWQTVFVVFGVILIPFALFAFINLIDGNANAPLNSAWVFLLTGVAGFAAALVGGVRYGALLGTLALIIAWLALWDELLASGLGADVGTLRGLLVIIGLIMLAIAGGLAMRGGPEGSAADTVTGAGVALVAAGTISLAALAGPFFPLSTSPAEASLLWDAWLLIVSLGLVGFGASAGVRGPVYVGGFGLLAFIYTVGLDLDDDTPSGSLLGWPLVLLILAAALIVVSAIPALQRTRE